MKIQLIPNVFDSIENKKIHIAREYTHLVSWRATQHREPDILEKTLSYFLSFFKQNKTKKPLYLK